MTSAKKQFRRADTLAEAQSVLDKLLEYDKKRYGGAGAKYQKAVDRHTSLFNRRTAQLSANTPTTTTTVGGVTVKVPTISAVYDEIIKQGLGLVGLGQQVQGNTTAIKSTSGGPPDFGKIALIGGGLLAVFYFFFKGK